MLIFKKKKYITLNLRVKKYNKKLLINKAHSIKLCYIIPKLIRIGQKIIFLNKIISIFIIA